MVKILIVSHSPYSPTGYGRVVRALAGSLMAAGNQIVCLGGGTTPPGASLPYPVIPWKEMLVETIAEAIKNHRPNVLLTIGDPWMFEAVPALSERQSTVWLAYYPVDGYPLPASWKHWAQAVDVPVVFSKFARDVVQSATGKAPELIYHGVNTTTFSPVDREQAKKLANVAGHFVVGTVARNQMRKNIPALVKAFAKFSKGKDDAILYLHTQLKGEFDIAKLVQDAGIEEKTRITDDIRHNKGVSDHLLATVYRAMDLFVLPTMAEGFGLPIMESQACGTPALVTDFSACPELVPDPIQRLKVKDTLTMARNFEQAIVDVDDIVEKLELFYRDRERLKALGERCHQFAKLFEWEIAYKQFNELMASPQFQSIAAMRRKTGGHSEPAKGSGPFSQTPIGSKAKTAKSGKNASPVDGNSPPSPPGDAFNDVDKLHAEAVAKMRAGKVAEAVPLLKRVAALRPNNPEFQNQLAVALQSDGRVVEAIEHFERSVKLRPDRHQVWTNLGQACLKIGQIARAREACERALEMAPKSALAHDLFGVILRDTGAVAEARHHFKQALILQPDLAAAAVHLEEMGASKDPPVITSPSTRSGLTEQTALLAMDREVAALSPYSGGFEGTGIVIIGGGIRYFPCAWICIRMLRECGCLLPIELWHLGQGEMSDQMRTLVGAYDVQCVDGRLKASDELGIQLDGWELKPFAIMHSRFREVLYLDADNFPLVDPEFLFQSKEYKEHGAVFWPDYGQIKPTNKIWELTGVPYRDEPAFETGQILIDKSRCWEPLSLTMWMNQTSDFWYRYLLGDKDTFHIAWSKLDRRYAMPSHRVTHLKFSLAQHDFDGRRTFQHRNRAKWVMSGWNAKTDDFEKENRGYTHLEELRTLWTPEIHKYDLSATRRLQEAWNRFLADPASAGELLSAPVGDSTTWKLIGNVVEHTARCIDDSHTLYLVKQAIDAAPQLAELQAIMGTSLANMGRQRDALKAFREAYRLAPNLPGLASNMELSRSGENSVLPHIR